MRLLPAPIWTLLLLACAILRAEPVESLVTAVDLLQIRQLSSPAISPDGKSVVYAVRSIETLPSGEHAYRNRLWLASLAGDSAPRELVSAGPHAYSPAWHPSGDRIVYVRPEAADVARLWIMPLSGGEPYSITPPLRGVSSPAWSPDGRSLLFSAVVAFDELKGEPSWSPEIPGPAPVPAPESKPAPAKPAKTPPPPAADGPASARREWLALNESRRNPAVSRRLDFNASADGRMEFVHVFVIEKPGAAPVDATPGFHSYIHPAWLADNRAIVCSGPADETVHPDRVLRRRLVLVDASAAGPRELSAPPGHSLDHPAVSPDGNLVACTAQPCEAPADLSYGQTLLATVPVEGDGKPRFVTAKLDRPAGPPRWSADGKHLYFNAETGGGVPLHRVAVPGGSPERIGSADTWITAFDVGREDLALASARPANPGELYRASPAGRSSRILTSHNSDWLRDKKTASLERRTIKRPDGVTVEYWVVKPPYLEGGYHYPLLLMIHGGPAAMWGASNPALWHEIQFFAARGYGVVFANPRGSTGYGAKFQRGSFRDWAEGPAGDVLAAAEAVAKENWVDRDRQVVLGGSYGAYLAAWILSTDQRFKAGVVARGVYDLTTFFGEGDAWPLVPWHFGGYPWDPEVRKLLDAQSPIIRADSIRTPLLIKQNDADNQTGTAQGELLYRALKILGRPVELVRYPRATHDLSRTGDPGQRIDRLVRFDEFFQRFVGVPAQPIPPPPPPPAQGK